MTDYWAKYINEVNLNSKKKRFNFIMDYIDKASSDEEDNGEG